MNALSRSTICVFLLSRNFFNDARTLALLRTAVNENKQVERPPSFAADA